MTPELLKQALEALEECKNALSHGFDERTGQPVFKSVAAMLAHISASNAASALTAFDSLSEYDKAIHALAAHLPDGWVAQEESGWICFHSSKPHHDSVGENEGFWISESGVMIALSEHFKIPKCFNWHESLRRITHNSDGTVTVERG